ncbi:hypothetical protein J5N97_025537 [Dioscorea zingiberensis]|uniref:Cation/H+ exchanger domain-containing protein n=1 Tax=Dioscorea zingiberensis TaxID=325984 RepID=A0A9D5CA01_9LILI|nr:hypothetical protein J5N97_025537 [Dioscorea zingiberensis]
MIFLFLVGVKTDLSMIRKTGKKAVGVAILSTLLPITIVVLMQIARGHTNALLFLFYLVSKCSTTSYTVLSCILEELNLLSSKLGRIALSAALIDFFNYFNSSIFIAISVGMRTTALAGVKSLLALIFFVLFITLVLSPVVIWMIKKTPEERMLDEWCFLFILFFALALGLATDLIGHRATMGPFYFGLLLPGGPPLGMTMVEKLDRLVCGVFLPVLIAVAGLRMDLGQLDLLDWGILEIILFLCAAEKFIGALVPCLYCRMSLRDAVTIALMMSTKGIFKIEIANSWLDTQVVDAQQHSMLLFVVIVFGDVTAPLVKLLYRPEDRFVVNKRRTILHLNPNAELCFLSCVHSQDHVRPIISLLEASTPSPDSPLCIYVLYLSPLASRSAAILHPYNKHKNSTSMSSSTFTTESDRIFKAFLYLEQQFADIVSVLPYISISPYTTMHDYVCSLALDKKSSLIILPFHRGVAIDGTIKAVESTTQEVNMHVLRYAPCYVGILVNQVGGGSTSKGLVAGRIVVFFLGGADDREALAYAMRMAINPLVEVMVVRIRLQRGWEGEERVDDEVVEGFRRERRVVYREEVVRDSTGTAGVIKGMVSEEFEGLVVVGMREGVVSALTEGLDMWSEYPELGVLGDILASPEFGDKVATLVVQQQRGVGGGVTHAPAPTPVVERGGGYVNINANNSSPKNSRRMVQKGVDDE